MTGAFFVIMSHLVGLKISASFVETKRYNSAKKKKKDERDEIILFARTKQNTTEILVSKALFD